ncbi:hypothetical protein [Haliangium sp.]|uniref:hypothetical protein n=1 Tax=Haliangium sp. TaxID=2663208 RepID=UPI003D127762
MAESSPGAGEGPRQGHPTRRARTAGHGDCGRAVACGSILALRCRRPRWRQPQSATASTMVVINGPARPTAARTASMQGADPSKPARDLYREICAAVSSLPIFVPWDEAQPFLDRLSALEPGHVLEGPEFQLTRLQKAYEALDDADKIAIAEDWDKLVNALQIANEVAMSSIRGSLAIGRTLLVGGREAFEEQPTGVLPAAALEPTRRPAQQDASIFARVAEAALWQSALRRWQVVTAGLVLALVGLVSYMTMDHVDALTTPIVLDDVELLEVQRASAATLPAPPPADEPGEAVAAPVPDHDPIEAEPTLTAIEAPSQELPAVAVAPETRPRPAEANADRTDDAPMRTRAKVPMGRRVQHIVLTRESETERPDDVITLALKPGLPRQIESTTETTRRVNVPRISEFELEIEVEPDMVKGDSTGPKHTRSLTVIWRDDANLKLER